MYKNVTRKGYGFGISTQRGNIFYLTLKTRSLFSQQLTLRCASPHHRHRKLGSENTDVAIGIPVRETAEWVGKPKNKTNQNRKPFLAQQVKLEASNLPCILKELEAYLRK